MNYRPVPAESTDPVGVLREAIGVALPPLRLVEDSPEAADSINMVLHTFAKSVSPVLDQLATMAAAEPGGSVATALQQLRRVFNRRGTNTSSPTCRWQMRRAYLALERHRPTAERRPELSTPAVVR